MASAPSSSSNPSAPLVTTGVVAGTMSWDPIRKRLLGAELSDALAAATELRQNIDVVHSTEFPLMLSALLPSLSTVLTNRTQPSSDPLSVSHKLRNTVLDIMSKFPLNSVLRPHAPHLVAVALSVLRQDYEENALTACRIIFDLYKVYRNLPNDSVQPYMDFVVEVYRRLPMAVQQNFNHEALSARLPSSSADPDSAQKTGTVAMDVDSTKTPASVGAATETASGTPSPKASASLPSEATPSDPKTPNVSAKTPSPRKSPSQQHLVPPLKSNASFRVLTECPLIVMLMFQLYPKFVKTNIPSMIGAMMNALTLRPPRLDAILKQQQMQSSAGTPPASGNGTATNTSQLKRLYYDRYRELIAAQAKTLSFLTYLLRGFSSDLKPYQESLAQNVVALMANCPKESVSTRKELLVATRHLLNNDFFRLGFLSHVDALLDERVLLGGYSQHYRFSDQTLLRPLAYTTLSDLVQHFSSRMSLQQLSRVVLIFSRVLHDVGSPVIPMSTQYAAVRTLFSVVDIVYRKNSDGSSQGTSPTPSKATPSNYQARAILVRIMRTLVDKLYSLVDSFDAISPTRLNARSKGDHIDGKEQDKLMVLDIVVEQSNLASSRMDSVREYQSIVRAIIVNLKTVLNYISSYRKREAGDDSFGDEEASFGARGALTNYEIEIVERYIHIIFPATQILKQKLISGNLGYLEKDSVDANSSSLDQYRDTLTYFAASFARLDGISLRQTLGSNLDLLVDAIMNDSVAMVIPRHLLACNPKISFELSSVLLEYLVGRMHELSVPPVDDSIVFLPRNVDEVSEMEHVRRAFAGPIESFEQRTQKSNVLLQLFERILKSLAVYAQNESVVRKQLKKMVVLSFRSAMEHVNEWTDNNCVLLRYIFRSISAGKFEESYKELLPLIPAVLNGLYRVLCTESDASVVHTAIELCLTIPARLSSLLPHLNLLLRVIVPALDSDSGDLVNLGLRTLEFWVDNLNPMFLYPELSKQVDLLSLLMRSLSRHLKPAPYPFGLLTLRLLGKLGGKNRAFLRDTFPLIGCDWNADEICVSAEFSWREKSDIPPDYHKFSLPLPLREAVEHLKQLCLGEPLVETNDDEQSDSPKEIVKWSNCSLLWDCDLEKVNFGSYSFDVMSETKTSQADAALHVVAAAMNLLIKKQASKKPAPENDHQRACFALRAGEKLVCTGLLFAASMEQTKAEAVDLISQFLPRLHPDFAARIITDFLEGISDNKVAPVLAVMKDLLQSEIEAKFPSTETKFLSCLLRSLCGACSSNKWGKEIGVTETLLFLLKQQGREWCYNHEGDLITAAFVNVKTAPREISLASTKAARFFFRVCVFLYGNPFETETLVLDPLIETEQKSPSEEAKAKPIADSDGPSEESLRLALQEMVCPQQMVRICARFFFKHFVIASRGSAFFTDHASLIKRSLFSRHLRLLPLPHQVGLVEALTLVISEAPGLFPLTESHLLNFLSELLKMCSVADGDMLDKSLMGIVVDKNGYTSAVTEKTTQFPTHSSSLFLRRKSVVDVMGTKVILPEELPCAVQLRVSAIRLLHMVIRGYTDPFFDSEPTTGVGNIRPHMISLLFRSLVSHPHEAVVASHVALRDVLGLSTKTSSEADPSRSQSRLPKELLQTCIRPVLLNLRDYTRLSIPLLRGLSRLLSLLNSWFNKTLGEKLLDHLKKWMDPQRIISLRIWNEGEEPMVAAAIIEVFWKLPQASKFVEPLVVTCLKLEGKLAEYKMRSTRSPFRPHLARFLNKYPQAAAEFFFQRLKYPIYSELFQSILKDEGSQALRDFLSNKQSSVMLLNVCFERPLAIMRSEKSANAPVGQSPLGLHGIGVSTDPVGPHGNMSVDALEVQLQGLKTLTTLIRYKRSYFSDHGDITRAMRLLWRSRGRFLRLQHEEQVSPRFHDETSLMRSFLMNFATSVAREDIDSFVDALFELLCIFLQSATFFSSVRSFLGEAPLLLLNDEKKKYFASKILKRLGSESNEETKVLSIQLLLLPLLSDSCQHGKLAQVLENSMVDAFINEILFQKGSPALCGDRLRVEFLQLLSVFVDGAPDSLSGYKKEIVRYCSSLLKSEDIACTSWAYIVICQLTKVFGTSEKTSRQVYTALIRSHHQEGKELVRAALDVLMPALEQRLPASDVSRIVSQTAQIMLEESNSTPQLAHICLTVIKGKSIFSNHKQQFASLMVGTLNRLGLATGGPFENKFLASEVIRLILEWESDKANVQQLLSTDEKGLILNFVVRQLLLLSEPDIRSLKADQGVRNLSVSLKDLLGKVLAQLGGTIQPQHFDKVNQAKPDSAVLATSIDILAVVSTFRKTKFLQENRALVTHIVVSAFEAGRQNEVFRSKINDYAMHAVLLPGQCDVLATSLEKILLENAQSLLKKSPPSHANEARRAKTKDVASQADVSYLHFALELIGSLCHERKSFLTRLDGSLLQLASVLAKEHISDAIAKQRQGSSSNSKTTFTGILHHTPTKGIIEIIKGEPPDATRQQSGRSKNPKNSEVLSYRSLFLILKILEKHDIMYSLSLNRKVLYQVISNLLDHSDSAIILMMATRIVGKWLLAPGGGSPVILKERNSLLWKLSSFDFRCLSNDVVAQPVADMIRHFIQSFRASELGQSDDLVFDRSLVSCLMHSNVAARKQLFNEYISTRESESLTALDLLWRLLHSDFEGIGGRYLIVVLVEALLTLIQCDDADVEALSTLIHGDEKVCQSLFEHLLPICWSFQDNHARARLARAMEMLLSKPYHSQFLHPGRLNSVERSTTNTPRALLNSLLSLDPLPLFDTNLLVSVAENYNAWHEVLCLLEKQYQGSKNSPRSAKTLSAMRHCYRQLAEDTAWMSLARESCQLAMSKKALSLDLGIFLPSASETYLELIDLVQQAEITVSPSEFEMDLWEERWVEIQRQVCQLEAVSEYATASGNHRLQLDCAWRSQDWGKVRSLCSSPSLLVAGESGDATVKLSETLLAVADGKLGEVENLHAQSAQLCLYKWQLLPQLSSGSPVHASLFHFFHRLVEVRESGQIMVETSNHSDGRTLPDLKNLLNAWRGRLPNDCESMMMWDEILAWRNHMFGAITKNFHWSEPNVLATLHDRPWTAIRFAKTARKQNLRDVSLLLLNRASDKSTMNVLDAYLQLREQILAYLKPGRDTERHGGLNLVNTTNLSFFDPSQRSELFRLKATFLASLGNRSKANQAFCHSVQICPSHARAWVDWGNLCAELGGVAEQQVEKSAGDGQSQRDKAANSKKVAQYLAQAIGCYLEAIRLDTHEWARLHIGKCLWMLSKDGGSPGVLCSTFESRGSLLPCWVWIPWLPQLLSGLFRPEGLGLKQLLATIARSYPQAIYYPLRAFYLERRDVERARGTSQSGSNQHMPSVLYSEELLTLLRRSHASLCSMLETILEELIVKFRPSTEEDFLGTIIALEERLEGQMAGLRKSEEESMSQSCWKTLGRIAIKYFRQSDSANNRRDERARQNAEFKDRYRKKFEDDFCVLSTDAKSEASPSELQSPEALLSKIREWRADLHNQVMSGPTSLKLVEVSRALAVFGLGEVPDLWPGACDPRYTPSRNQNTEPRFNPESSTQQTTSSSAAAARKAATNAANVAAAAAKKEGFGGDFGGSSAVIEIPGNYMPNNAWTDSRPNPELHPKLVRFEPTMEIIRRKENLVRRIGMIGNDGKTHHFVLCCALSYWTRTDERTAQTQFVVDKLLRKNIKTARAHLSLKPHPVIPVAQRLRLQKEPDHWTSLEQEAELSKLRSGDDDEALGAQYNAELRRVLSGPEYEKLQDSERMKFEREKRVVIFRNLCQTKASSNILRNQMLSFFRSTELLYKFKRSFTQQWATDCLFQTAFSIAERSPDQVVFFRDTGATMSNDARILYNSHGYIDKTMIPFRMTQNLATLIGFPFLDGMFVRSLTTVAEAVTNEKEIMESILHLILRDDLVAFYTKSLAKPDSKTQEMEKQLHDRISKNTLTVKSRFASYAPHQSKNDDPIDHNARKLLMVAQNDDQLCMMPSTFQAWL